MNLTNATQKAALAAIAIYMVTGSLLFAPRSATAQDTSSKRPSVRERIKERWQARQQTKAAAEAPSDATTRIDQPGDYSFTLLHDGLTRKYRVHVPQRYRAASPAPLLLAFHGGGGDMDYQASDTRYGLISKSESEGFIAVFPNGYSKLPSGKLATWNAGNCCGGARDHGVDDVGFVRAIIAKVSNQLAIDRGRIYATGMSNGAMMAYRLACEMPDTFAAIAAVAGTDNTRHCDPAVPVSVLHIHARNDDRVLFTGGAGKKFGDLSAVTDFAAVPATVAKWVAHNGCNATPQRVLTTPGAYCERYAPCQGNTHVQLCVTEAGGHSWPGGSKNLRGGEPPSTAINVNDVMWTFFSATPAKTPGPVSTRSP